MRTVPALIGALLLIGGALWTEQGDRQSVDSVAAVSEQIEMDRAGSDRQHVEPPEPVGHESIVDFIMRYFRSESMPDAIGNLADSVYKDGLLGNGRAPFFGIFFFLLTSGGMPGWQVLLSILWIATWAWLF